MYYKNNNVNMKTNLRKIMNKNQAEKYSIINE